MIKGKRGRRALYGLVGAVMAFTAVGGAAAKETKPYKAPELRLVRGTEDYDLTEGITYDKGKYELMVEDTGNFDIEVPGKYTVEYSLTPLEDGVSAGNGGTGSSGGSVSGGSGSSGGGGGSGSSSAGGGTSVKESEAETGSAGKDDSQGNTSSGSTGSADSQKPDQDNTGSGTEDKSDSDKNNGNSESGSTGTGSSEDKDSGDQNTSDKENSDKGNSDQGSSDKDTGDKDSSDTGSTDQGSSDKDSGSNSGSENGGSNSGNSSGSDSSSSSGNDSSSSSGNSIDSGSNSSGSSDLAGSGTTAKAEGSFFSRLAARWIGTAYAAELPLNKKESHADKEDKADQEIVIGETKTEKTSELEISEAAKENSKADKEADAPVKETGAADQENGKADQETGKEQGTDSAAETNASESGSETAADGTLEETEDIIYFDRIVRVVPAEGDVNIEYDEPILEIPADTELFGVQIHRNVPVATSSNAERATASDADPKQESEVLWGDDEGFWVDSEEENTEETDDDSDGITEEGVEYDLILKNPDILLADAFLTDKDGKKIKKAKITVKDDSDLKTAAHVVINEKGVPYIENLYLGTYVVELASTDPETGEEIVCDREIQVIPSERILFDAPTLYIGTRNLSYDLTAGMMARDELNQEVKALYVVDETELLNAKEEAVATPSNAEAASEESPENGDDTETELRLKKGLYHVVIGAKHPLTGEEFTVDRKVEVVDGYYIYAPVLEIPAGSTDYDLTSGAEVRNASDSVGKAVEGVQISVEDISDLYRGTEAAEENVDADDRETDDTETETPEEEGTEDIAAISTYSFSAYSLASLGEAEEEETAAEKEAAASSGEAKTEKPAVKEGTYTVTLSAEDPETGEKISVVRQVRAAARTVGLFTFVSHGSDTYANGKVDTLGGLIMVANGNWSNFQSGTASGTTMKDGGDPDVKVSGTTADTNLADVSIESFITGFNGLSEDSSISVDGNNKAFAWDKGTKNPSRNWSSSLFFNYKIPPMQVRLQNFRMENATWNISAFSEAASTRLTLKDGTYLELKNIVSGPAESGTLGRVGYSNDIDKKTKMKGNWKELAGSNAEYANQSTSVLRLLPQTTADRNKYDVKLTADNISEMSPLYHVIYPKNLTIDANCEGGLGPVAAEYISDNFNINTHENGKVELYFLWEAKSVILNGKGTIAFRNAWSPVQGRNGIDLNANKYKHGFWNIQNLVVNDDMLIQRSVHDYAYPIFTFKAGATTSFGNHKITVAESSTVDGSPKRIQKETVVANAQEAGVVNVFDFKTYGVDTQDKNTAQPFVTYANDRKQVKAVLKTGGNIEVKNTAGVKQDTFCTYKDALNYLNDKSGSYTISNNVEAVFTKEDAEALKAFSNNNVSLTFESGVRTDNGDKAFDYKEDFNSKDSIYRYRILLECGNEIELPKNLDVTFYSCLFQLKRGIDNVTIIGNGGETRFKHLNRFVKTDDDQEIYPDVYGGTKAAKAADAKDAVICVESKAFTGNTGFHVMEYTNIGSVRINKLYNFDTVKYEGNDAKLYFYGDVLADKEGKTPDAGGYKGCIQVKGHHVDIAHSMNNQLFVVNPDTYFVIGSLDLSGGSIDIARRAEYEEKGETISVTDIRNKYVPTLTAQKPITSTKQVIYNPKQCGQQNDRNNEILFYMPNVPKDRKQEYITGQMPTNSFMESWNGYGTYNWVPFTDEVTRIDGSVEKNYTIRYVKNAIFLKNEITGFSGNFTNLTSLLEYMKSQEKERSGSNYIVSWWGTDASVFTLADSQAMKNALTTLTTPEQITWTASLNGAGGNAPNRYLNVQADFQFFGKKNVLNEINLTAGSNEADIYANGLPLTVGSGSVSVSGNADNMTIYGGSKDNTVASSDLTIHSGTLQSVSGGGKQEGTVTGTKKITIQTSGTTSNAVNAYISVKDIRDYGELNVGAADSGAGNTQLQVNGIIDSKFAVGTATTEYTDQVILQNAEIQMYGSNQSYIGTLKPVGDNAIIKIYKKEFVTVPLQIDKEVVLDSEQNKLKLTTTDDARAGDLLLKFPQKGMADITKYVDAQGTYEIKTNRDTNEILFGTKADAYIMTVTDHGTEADPASAITDKPVSALAEYVGSGEKDINNNWSLPTKSTLADLYNVVYNNTQYGSKTKPTMGTVNAKDYFNRTGYGFRDENWEPKLNAAGTLDTTAEAAVIVKMGQNFEQYQGTQSTARPTYLNESRTKTYVWNGNSFKNLASSLSLDKYSSLSIDGQGRNLDIDGYQAYFPYMQIEFKNFKYIPRNTYLYRGSFANTTTGGSLNGTSFPSSGMSSTERGVLRFNNISSDPYDGADLKHQPTRGTTNYLRVWSNIDVDLIGSDKTPDTVSLILAPDRYRQMYVKAGSKGMASTFHIIESYKKLTIDTNGSYVNMASLGLDASGTYFKDKNAEYKMVVGGNGAIRIQPFTRDSTGAGQSDSGIGLVRGPRAMARSLELTSEIVISKYAGKPCDSAADPRSTPALQLTELNSNGHLVYITLGVNKYDTTSYTNSVRNNLEPTDGMPFLEGYGENGSHLDPTDFRVLTEEKAKSVTGLVELGDWIDKDGSYGVVLKNGPSAVLTGNPNCDKIMFVKKEGGKINAVDSQSVGLGPQNGSFATYADAFKAISDSSDSNFTVTNQAAVEMLPSDLEALKQIKGQKHITFTSSDIDTTTPDKNRNYEIGSYGGQYHIRLRSRYFELPPNVSATFKHTIMRYNQSEEDIVFIANGGNLTFDEDVMFAEGRKAVIYGGSVPQKADCDGTDLSTSFKTEEAANITIKSGDFTAIYGGGTKAQGGGITQKILSVFNADRNSGKVGATITVNGGTIDRIYGGGQGTDGTMNGDTVVQINAGTVGTVYGGGDNADLTGSTSVEVADTNVTTVYGGGNKGKVDGNTQVILKDAAGAHVKSVYGGSVSAEVTGTSDVQILSRPNPDAFEVITADGSNESGTPANSVTGSKTITIKPAGNDPIQVTAGTVSGFSALNIGDGTVTSKDEVTSDANMTLTVTKRLDTWAEETKNDNRTNSTLTLYHSVLKVDIPAAADRTAGHIGSLNSTGLSKIYVHRNRPLVLDGKVAVGQHSGSDIKIQLYPIETIQVGTEQKQINLTGEKPMTFTNYVVGMDQKFIDVTSALPVSAVNSEYITGNPDTTKDLIFGKLAAHTTINWVEYGDEIEEVTLNDTDGIPSVTGKTVNKTLHISYRNNDHRAKAGYIIAMPKVGAGGNPLSEADQQQYTQMNASFMAAPGPNTLPANAVNLDFNYPQDQDAANTNIDITAVIPNADPKNYFYIMHVVCVESEITSSLLDLNAPVKLEEEHIGYDTTNSEYTVKVKFQDKMLEDMDKLPISSIGGATGTHKPSGHLIDSQSGIKQWAWSYEDKKDAAKLHWMDVDAESNTDRGDTGLNDITSHANTATTNAQEYSFRVPKIRNVAGTDETVTSVWLYVKDDNNNTTKCQITLKQDLIDVAVPTKVSVIAVKKPNGGPAELLAPVCYIENHGTNEIEARVSGFTTNDLMDDNGTTTLLKLVDKQKNAGFNNNELALFLTPVANSSLAHKSELKETNVKSINAANENTWAYIGRMGTKDQNARFLDFTFDADYQVQLINEASGKRLTSTMSYHFTAVHDGDKKLENAQSLEGQEAAVDAAE